VSREIEEFVAEVEAMLRAHFGSAAQSYWVYADLLCPGCQTNEIDEFILRGERMASVNGFMYREKAVLIGYFLCGDCAKKIMALKVYRKTPLHEAIESHLIQAYQRYLESQVT
jgi:hypothetical protein